MLSVSGNYVVIGGNLLKKTVFDITVAAMMRDLKDINVQRFFLAEKSRLF